MEFCKAFNERTSKEQGMIIPVVLTVYKDRSFSFITKTPPAVVLIKKALNLEKGSSEPNRVKVGELSRQQAEEIARIKMKDLNARNLDKAVKIIEGTARSMGVKISS
jgi:large subunit ribosomal protein L11